MIKLVYCITKLPTLGHSEFSEYWRDVHGPIGMKIPGLRKLVQSVAVRRDGDPDPDFDGMAELWFDDWEALARARQSAEWQASTADEVNFVDSSRTAYFVTEERQIL